MKTYIKGGIVTKITIINDNYYNCVLEKYFDLSMFDRVGCKYYLKGEFLNLYIAEYRRELLSFTEGSSDSISNSEAYILNTSADELLKNKIYLIQDNEKYYFENYYRMRFETDYVIVDLKEITISINFLPIVWSIDKTITESSLFFSILLNNLIRKTMDNKLKDVTWFTITS